MRSPGQGHLTTVDTELARYKMDLKRSEMGQHGLDGSGSEYEIGGGLL